MTWLTAYQQAKAQSAQLARRSPNRFSTLKKRTTRAKQRPAPAMPQNGLRSNWWAIAGRAT